MASKAKVKHSKRARKQKTGTHVLPKYQQRHKADYKTRGMPPESDEQLMFTHTSVQGAGAASFLKSFNPNTYIPENGGTLAPAQYVEWAALYDQYRVTRFHVTAEFQNKDSGTDVNAYLAITNETLSGGLFTDISNNPYARTKLLGPSSSGTSGTKLHVGKTVISLTANDGAPYADSFHAVINANPADVTWASVGAATTSGGNMTNGVSITVKVTMFIKFFSMNFVTEQVPPGPDRETLRAEAWTMYTQTKNVQYWLNYLHFSRHKKVDGKCSCPCKNMYSVHFTPNSESKDLRLVGPENLKARV